jgi:hypothetical protein
MRIKEVVLYVKPARRESVAIDGRVYRDSHHKVP